MALADPDVLRGKGSGGWPTKLSMTPILAEEVFCMVHAELKQPAGYDEPAIAWPTPAVARYPWENTEWFAVH